MNRQEAVKIIESLYPADAEDDRTREIGQELLHLAKQECHDWRNYTTSVLFRYAELCQKFEDLQESRLRTAGAIC